MPENRDFSHLPLPFLYRGKPKLRGFNSPSERTNRNRNNRAHHGEYLKRRSSELSQFWKTIFYKGIMPSETGFRFSSGL